MARVFNFNAGPATLPEDILKEAQKDLLDFKGSGMSLMEATHRGKVYEAVHNEAIANIKALWSIPDNFDIIFLTGGASSQFFMVPMNLLTDNDTADYISTGEWPEKAIKEANILGKKINVIATSKDTKFNRIPTDYKINKNAKYVYIASNNTIEGTQYKTLPKTDGVPLIIDASSDVFSYPIDWSNIGLIFAGAQKNAGPSGVTIVIIRKDLVATKNNIPTILKYSTHVENNSLYNTPPTFIIYLVGLMVKWLIAKGGIKAIQGLNEKKAKLIYDAIDNSNGYYKGHAEKDSRSLMNITFNLKTPELEEKFAKEAEKAQLVGLKGHRAVGGIRASVYNAMPIEGCIRLAEYMKDFIKNN